MPVMIDWLDLVLPCKHERQLFGGTFTKADFNGEVKWSTLTRLSIEGSYSSFLSIISDGPERIRLSGNYVKFLQGHNIFGISDIFSLLMAVMEALLREDLGLNPTANDLHAWRSGNFEIKMIDVTGMYPMPSREAVRAWVRSAAANAHLTHRGSAIVKGGTAYWGKQSRLWAIKAYCKGDEVEKHKLVMNIPFREHLLDFADNKLRIEVRLFGRTLKPDGIWQGQQWMATGFPEDEYLRRLSKLQLSDQTPLAAEKINDLPPRALMVYSLWLRGEDVRPMLSKSSFYNYRRLLLPHGIDLTSIHKGVEHIPLSATLSAGSCFPPEWAYGTPVLFNPLSKSPV